MVLEVAQAAVVLLEVDSESSVVAGEPSRVVQGDTTILHTCVGVYYLHFELADVPVVQVAAVVELPLRVVEVVG